MRLLEAVKKLIAGAIGGKQHYVLSSWSIGHSSKLLVLSALPLQTPNHWKKQEGSVALLLAVSSSRGKKRRHAPSSMLARRNVQATMCKCTLVGKEGAGKYKWEIHTNFTWGDIHCISCTLLQVIKLQKLCLLYLYCHGWADCGKGGERRGTSCRED